MTKDEALKIAIETLENANTIITQRCRVLLDATQPAFNACEEALEQPAQEPVGVVSWHEGAVMGSIFPSSICLKMEINSTPTLINGKD